MADDGRLSFLGRHLRRFRIRREARRLGPDARWKPADYEPETAGYRAEQQEQALAEACLRLGVTAQGRQRSGFRRKSVGCAVNDGQGRTRWLKLNGFNDPRREWLQIGEDSSHHFPGVRRPEILKRAEWLSEGVIWRATLFTLAPSPSISDTPWITQPLTSITDKWLAELKEAVASIGQAPISRWFVHPGRIATFVARRYGRKAPYEVDEWRTAHGDMNWSNLTAPNFTILDWEYWGAAPRGFDAASLLSQSVLDGALCRKLEALFSNDLETPSGLVARLYTIAARLEAVELGLFDPRLHRPLEAEASRLLRL